MRILIVDDHAVVRKGLIHILTEGFPFAYIEEAADAAELLQKVDEASWHIVISDLSMPGRSGLDALVYIRQYAPALPVLILSMHAEEHYALRALKAGAAGYLVKDAAPEELIKAVQAALLGKKYITSSVAEKLVGALRDDNEKPLHALLSDRELEVLRLLAGGESVSGIAGQLSLSLTTISTYRSRILNKMHMKSNADLARYAMEQQLL